MRACPRCASPARVHDVQERGVCSSALCAFDFCVRCALAFHGAADCSAGVVAASPRKKHAVSADNIIGSRKSRKKLRRL